jgi:hypothetical protein
VWRLTSEEYLEEFMFMGMFSKAFGKATKQLKDRAGEDAELSVKFPTVEGFLCLLQDDEGKPRQTCTFTVVVEDGMFKGGLKDRDHQMSVWRSGETLEKLLEALETCLAEGTADWKKSDYKSRK